jgi:hypothetical protein
VIAVGGDAGAHGEGLLDWDINREPRAGNTIV